MTTRETYSVSCLKPWWIISGIGVCFIASKDMVRVVEIHLICQLLVRESTWINMTVQYTQDSHWHELLSSLQ